MAAGCPCPSTGPLRWVQIRAGLGGPPPRPRGSPVPRRCAPLPSARSPRALAGSSLWGRGAAPWGLWETWPACPAGG